MHDGGAEQDERLPRSTKCLGCQSPQFARILTLLRSVSRDSSLPAPWGVLGAGLSSAGLTCTAPGCNTSTSMCFILAGSPWLNPEELLTAGGRVPLCCFSYLLQLLLQVLQITSQIPQHQVSYFALTPQHRTLMNPCRKAGRTFTGSSISQQGLRCLITRCCYV
jgi:hypothetical protein